MAHTTRACDINGCDKPHRARGYCSTHYNQLLVSDRHKRTVITCTVCGVTHQSSRATGRFCTLECRDIERRAATSGRREAERLKAALPVLWRRAKQEAKAPPRYMDGVWVSGPCAWCGQHFTVRTTTEARWCSKRCVRSAGKAKRRAREAGATGAYTWAEVVKLHLLIDRTCAYCWQPVEQPDPDHVHPLSRGGSNSIHNIVPTCRPCNNEKNDKTLTEWAAWRINKGLRPRKMNPVLAAHCPGALLAA